MTPSNSSTAPTASPSAADLSSGTTTKPPPPLNKGERHHTWLNRAAFAVDALVFLILALVGDGIEAQKVQYV